MRFESPPVHLVEAFKRHVHETGQPETFEGICNDAPPTDGAVHALWTEIKIPRLKRPLKDRAPCPICSRSRPKWLDGGTLIWCQATQFIYAIGPDCYSSWFRDGRLDQAINALRRSQAQHDRVLRLANAVKAASTHQRWIEINRYQARRAGAAQASLMKEAPRFRRTTSDHLRSTMAGGIKGEGFLRGGWGLERRLDAAERFWTDLQTRASGKDPQSWAGELSDRVSKELIERLTEARKAMQYVYDRLETAAYFLAPDNITRIGKWATTGAPPLRFDITHTASSVSITCGEEKWRGPVGLPQPSALPPRV